MSSSSLLSKSHIAPQECFNKTLETVAALRPILEAAATKKYTPAELRRLWAACSLSIPEIESALPTFHEQLLTEGRTKKGAETVIAHALRPQWHTNDPGLVYVSAKLVSDVKECKYRLGWDTSYRNCHREISPFDVPHMSMKHQQERNAYQVRLQRATTTILGDIKKDESSSSPSLQDYHGLLQLLSNYVCLLGLLLGTRSAHTREVVAFWRKLGEKSRPIHRPWTTRNYIPIVSKRFGCSRMLRSPSQTFQNASRVPAPIHHQLHWIQAHPNGHHGSPARPIWGPTSSGRERRHSQHR
jgi:hypothetical protein